MEGLKEELEVLGNMKERHRECRNTTSETNNNNNINNYITDNITG